MTGTRAWPWWAKERVLLSTPVLRPLKGLGHHQAALSKLCPLGWCHCFVQIPGWQHGDATAPAASTAHSAGRRRWGGGPITLTGACKHDGQAWNTSRVTSREGRVVYSLLELVLPLEMLPNHTIILTISNSKICKMMNGLFSGLSLLERLPWSMLPPEAILVSQVHTAVNGHINIHDLCCSQKPC